MTEFETIHIINMVCNAAQFGATLTALVGLIVMRRELLHEIREIRKQYSDSRIASYKSGRNS